MKNHSRLALALAASFTSLLVGCGPADPATAEMELGPAVCVDMDGDGYGDGCAPGLDCDDLDPTIHEGCKAKDAGPVCKDGDRRQCKVQLATNGGVASCFVGVEDCKDGEWSGDCKEDKSASEH